MANLITLEEVKLYSSITSTNQDAAITALLPRVSQFIKNYCGRTFVDHYTSAKTETFSGGTPSLFLTEMPVNNILDFEYSEDFGETYNSLVEFTDFAYNIEMETLDVLYQSYFPKNQNAYRVIYTGGYAECPADLKQAAIDLVVYYMKSDMAVKSTRSPGSSATQVEYVVNATVPSHIRRVLDYYRLSL